MASETVNHDPAPASPSELDSLRERIDDAFKSFAAMISAARRPLPDQTGNGKYLNEDPPDILDRVRGGIADLGHLGIKDITTMLEMQRKKLSGEPTDDKEYLMEGLIEVATGLPDGSKTGEAIANGFLTQLWNDLQHPPKSYLGSKYQYREADGSHNSLLFPQVGAANTPYARTVEPKTMQPGALPDPGVIFDSVMARKKSEDHPNKISSVLFYLASIIIHDLFRTDHADYRNSKTSSYLDLAPLYGSVQEEQDQMRTFKDGKIKPDCFSEKRLMLFPPGVGCLLIMFNRFHNYVVGQLALINERGKFDKPVEGASGPRAKTWEQYDNDLFQTGRLITCGLYINIILTDYVRTILNLNRTDSNWRLDPRSEFKNGPPVGVGNQVSAEFNLVYRWHSTISLRDEKWTEELWENMFPGADPKTINEREFLARVTKIEATVEDDPVKRNFAGLKRGDNGFDDDDLVKIMTESIEDCANSFGAQRVPTVMRVIEMLGIQQARVWNVASLNEFREYFHLAPHKTFESINSDPHVAEQLKRLYDHPDLVELYPGLVAEEAKRPGPGSGLTPSYTVSRAVLSDAVGLVRGDRFYTVDYHPKKLTNWGFSEVKFDPSIDNGCLFYKLFMRAFPNHFDYNSVYAHYPLTVPSEMKEILTRLGKVQKYSFDRPSGKRNPKMLFSYAAIESVLHDQDTFKVTWGKAMEFLMGSHARNFMLSGDGPSNAQSRNMMERALYVDKWDYEVKSYYENITRKLLKQKSYELAGKNQVDIVRDVGNLAHVHFCAEMFSLPLKTEESPLGIFTEYELYLIMAGVFVLVFFDVDPAASFPVHQKAHKATKQLGGLVEANVAEVKAGGFFSSVMRAIRPRETPLSSYGIHFIRRLLQSGMDVKELVWGHIMGTAGGMVPNQGQLFAQTIEYFLGAGREHLPEINRLAKLDTEEADTILMHYFLEGSRLNGESAVYRYVTKDTEIDDNGRKVQLQVGDKVVLNFKAASRDLQKFPDPEKLDLNRPVDSYIGLGAGPHRCLGLPMTRIALTTMLKTICRLDNLRPVPGPQGKIHKVLRKAGAGAIPEKFQYHAYLTENHDMFFPFPCSLKVNWDGEIP